MSAEKRSTKDFAYSVVPAWSRYVVPVNVSNEEVIQASRSRNLKHTLEHGIFSQSYILNIFVISDVPLFSHAFLYPQFSQYLI